MKFRLAPLACTLTFAALAGLSLAAARPAPKFPNATFTLHDDSRPKPRIVTPGDFSQNAKPPSDAVLLFDGKDASKWLSNRNQPAAWRVDADGGYIESGRNLGGGPAQFSEEWGKAYWASGARRGAGNLGAGTLARAVENGGLRVI